MKIVLDTIPIIYSEGADHRTTLNLYRELLKSDERNEYALFCIDRFDRIHRYKDLLAVRPVPIHTVPTPARIMEWAWNITGWPRLEQITGKADLYHVSGILAPPTKRAKVLVTVHGIVAEVIPERLPKERVEVLRKVLRLAMRRADYYLAVSESTRQDMVKHLSLDPANIYVVHHGVDPIFRPIQDRRSLEERLKKRFGIARPYILFVGAIGHHKNVMGILEAYRLLRAAGLTTHDLYLAGPPDSAWLEAGAFANRHGLGEHIHLTGQIKQEGEDLTDLYNGADCFVFPSYYEGWCSPPVEAMACGTPVIASNRSSIPETVGEGALLVDPDDHSDICQKLIDILTDESRRNTLIKRGFKRVSELGWRQSALDLIEVYKKLEEKM